MSRRVLAALAIALSGSAIVAAQRGAATKPPAAPPAPGAVAKCAADLGVGVKSHRQFCDVIVSRDPADSIAITIPPHRGPATLRFDLHNRFTIPIPDVPPAQAFARHLAVVAIIRPTGSVIDRAAVAGEFRRVSDVYDQIAGGGPGGLKIIAPGRAETVVIAIPAGLASLGIVGVRLDVTTINGRTVFETDGRPVAIVSNLRIEYTPLK